VAGNNFEFSGGSVYFEDVNTLPAPRLGGINASIGSTVYAVLTDKAQEELANRVAEKLTGSKAQTDLEALGNGLAVWQSADQKNRDAIAIHVLALAQGLLGRDGSRDEFRQFVRENLSKIGDGMMSAWDAKNHS
jgi:hypothetical protein